MEKKYDELPNVDGRPIRDIKAVPDELNREAIFVTFEEEDGSLATVLMHPVDITALLKQREADNVSYTFEIIANTPKS